MPENTRPPAGGSACRHRRRRRGRGRRGFLVLPLRTQPECAKNHPNRHNLNTRPVSGRETPGTRGRGKQRSRARSALQATCSTGNTMCILLPQHFYDILLGHNSPTAVGKTPPSSHVGARVNIVILSLCSLGRAMVIRFPPGRHLRDTWIRPDQNTGFWSGLVCHVMSSIVTTPGPASGLQVNRYLEEEIGDVPLVGWGRGTL